MIKIEEFVVIHALKRQGHSIRSIARITKIDRRTISKRLKEQEMKPYKERRYPSKVDSYKNYIETRLKQALPDRIPSTVILDEIQSYGYEGKIRILQNYMSNWYKEHQGVKSNKPIFRFETDPGFQAQVDWTDIRGGKKPIYAFVMMLGYSRAPFIYFTDSMKQEVWQECHERAFIYFGGTPKTILYDNLKSAIIKRDKYGKNRHGFNQAFLDFCKGHFIPKFCKPYRAQTKGKVERSNRYLKENFYIPLKASLKGSTIEITPQLLNSHIFGWIEKTNQRVHGTTGEKPAVRL
ncbi:MAG TPA: IS21 family transposase, partial [Epsilonproteobacteria bacterium]|nr:IS21 family transposase [Campylobacterota bacterium]